MVSEFVLSASDPSHFPKNGLPEYAFLGRSNVGKSSLINVLTRHKKLAFTSSTPGRTQTINFYQIDERLHLVDLPGYGYARVPRQIADQWGILIEQYLQERPELRLSFLILDARRGWTPKDLDLKQWLEFNSLPYQVIVTKMDKLNQSEQRRTLLSIAKIHEPAIAFSAVDSRGVREIWQAITKTQH